tara:strand:+ start:741 stop:1055 length:315 start_codon:yes stop_codon:yes gene_type:complete
MALSFFLSVCRAAVAAPFKTFLLLLPEEGKLCTYKEEMVLGAQNFLPLSFLKKSPSLFFAILAAAAAASPVPPTLSSPPFSSSSVCIPGGVVVEKESVDFGVSR